LSKGLIVGDIADMILDGDLCAGCGFIDEDGGDGYQRYSCTE